MENTENSTPFVVKGGGNEQIISENIVCTKT